MADGVWRVSIDVAAIAAPAFATALEPFCETVSMFGEEEEGAWRVEGLSPCEPDRSALGIALALAAACHGTQPPEARLEHLDSRNWLAENLARFPSFGIGRFFIYGSHITERAPIGRIGLLVDAGTAFGSGRHASTAGCLTALDDLSRRRFRRSLDMGCGSGILAIAMAKLWRASVLAADADGEAVVVTRQNARLNGVGDRVRAIRANGYHAPAIRAGRPFDLIVCNILARPIKRMAAGLARGLQPGGVAVLSGFLERDAAGVLFAHRASGLRLSRRITIDGWQTLVLTR
jgi:ribosomal protein L11 methyltransferase